MYIYIHNFTVKQGKVYANKIANGYFSIKFMLSLSSFGKEQPGYSSANFWIETT